MAEPITPFKPGDPDHIVTLKRLCQEYYDTVAQNGWDAVDDELKHYIFEEAMKMMLGHDVFERLRDAQNWQRRHDQKLWNEFMEWRKGRP